jgi:hypothetical protein
MGGEAKAGDGLMPESHVARMDDGCIAQRAYRQVGQNSLLQRLELHHVGHNLSFSRGSQQWQLGSRERRAGASGASCLNKKQSAADPIPVVKTNAKAVNISTCIADVVPILLFKAFIKLTQDDRGVTG